MIKWDKAIARNRTALSRIVAMLFAMAGLAEGETRATLPRHLRNAVLRILRPAEAAVRRLVLIAARGMKITLRPASPLRGDRRVASEARQSRVGVRTSDRGDLLPPPGSAALTLASPTSLQGGGGRARRSAAAEPQANNFSLPLIDPLKRFDFRPRRRRAKAFPRITFIGLTEPTPIPDGWFPAPDDEIDAAPLCRRLAALKRALDDIDGRAKRLARWKARRDLGFTRCFHPMRPGRPPGHRKRVFHEVDEILRECHALALSLEREDTS